MVSFCAREAPDGNTALQALQIPFLNQSMPI
jgi:hypothetical protein